MAIADNPWTNLKASVLANATPGMKQYYAELDSAKTNAEIAAIGQKYYANPEFKAEQQQALADLRGVTVEESNRQDGVQKKFTPRIWELTTGGAKDYNRLAAENLKKSGSLLLDPTSDRSKEILEDTKRWKTGFYENFDNPFIQGGDFVTEHYSSDRKLAEMLRDANVGDKIPVLARAEFLSPIIQKSGLTHVTPELQKLGEQFIFAGDAGYVKDAPHTGGWIENNLGTIAGIAGSLMGLGPVGVGLAAAGGTAASGGDFGDILKAGAGGFIGGSLRAPATGFGSGVSGSIYNAGQGVLNFLDPVIPDFIRSPGGVPSVGGAPSVGQAPNPLEGLDTSFTPPDFDSLPSLSLGSPGLEDALTNFTSPETLGLTIPAVPYVPGQIPDVTFDAPDFTVKPEDVFTGPSEPSLSSKIGDAIKAGKPETWQDYLSIASAVPGVVGLIGGALSGPTGGDAEERPAVYAPGTFTEGNVADYEPSSHGSPQAVTISRSAYNRASPFRKQLLQNAINTGKLVIEDTQNVGGEIVASNIKPYGNDHISRGIANVAPYGSDHISRGIVGVGAIQPPLTSYRIGNPFREAVKKAG